MKLVIVESPAKAKTLEKYLGRDYKVLASYGHIRDLPSKQGSINPQQDFAMTWEVDPKAQKHVNEIIKSIKSADHFYLATDPDREGEAISWHIQEVLAEKGLLKKIKPERISFNAITKQAVLNAIEHPREVNKPLVEAYLARLSLDYLVGFNLSPVLWRKLPGSRSAGRVQSVALRIIVERENEIDVFITQEYWTIETNFSTLEKKTFDAQLSRLDGKKLDKFSLTTQDEALAAVEKIKNHHYNIEEIEKKRIARNPAAPFTTSTLQQEASRKLGFSPKKTMQIAQRLYEGIDLGGETAGLITYMRTDSIQVDPSALNHCRSVIENKFGKRYLHPSARVYKSKVKNAQEAHEAVRPTDLEKIPKDIESYLEKDEMKLYELIWKRMIASQMASAEIDQTTLHIASEDKQIGFKATGSIIFFDGFLTLYRESLDEDQEAEENGKLLPMVQKGDDLKALKTTPYQHFTKPPPRYTEASLIKKLEELGIGRPSTYTRIISVLQERNYVRNEKRQLIPEDRGRLVTAFLLNYFEQYIEYGFTAHLEEQLDDISNGTVQWKGFLSEFWTRFHQAIENTKDITITDVLKQLEADLENFLFPQQEGHENRVCPTCSEGQLGLRLGKFGAFIGCSNYPTCKYTRQLTHEEGDSDSPIEIQDKELGIDPHNRSMIKVKKGPYGYYLQWGEATSPKEKPKRIALPKNLSPQSVTLEEAIQLAALPRNLGKHPVTNSDIVAGIGRFGPYIKYESSFTSLKSEDDVLTVSLSRALELIEENSHKKKRAPKKVVQKKPPAKRTSRGKKAT